MASMLELFTLHQEALKAAQDSSRDEEELKVKEEELTKLYNQQKRKLKKREKKEKDKEKDELIEQGVAEAGRRKVVDSYKLLQKKYKPHSKWMNYQEARTAIWVASGGASANWTPKSGRSGSNHLQSHHVGKDNLAYKITAKDREGPAILHVAMDNEKLGPVDALVGQLELSDDTPAVLSQATRLLKESAEMKSFLAKYLEKTPEQVIEADEEDRKQFMKVLVKGKDPSLAEMKKALAAAGEEGVELGGGRETKKGTAAHLLKLLAPEEEPDVEESEADSDA